MNRSLIAVALLMAGACCFADQASVDSEPKAPERADVVNDVYPRWSVIGEWRVTHPYWTDVLTLKADGTLVTTRQGTTGRWILTAESGTPLLVLKWDIYGTESLSMVGTNHFRGQIEKGSYIDMRRGEEGEETSPKASPH